MTPGDDISATSIAAIVVVCLTTLVLGVWGMRLARGTSDFYVAGRAVSPQLRFGRHGRVVPPGGVLRRDPSRRRGARARRPRRGGQRCWPASRWRIACSTSVIRVCLVDSL